MCLKNKQKIIGPVIILLSALLNSAHAYELPVVNLGATSFLDGGPPAGPGLYFNEYLQFYTTDTFNDVNGNPIPLPNPNLDVWVSVNQFIYLSDKSLFNGKLGIDVIIPYVSLDFTPTVIGFEDNGSGFGDLVVAPFIQWDTVMGANGFRFVNRFELEVILPTGKYDNVPALNPSSDFVSINPYWAATFFATPKWSVSWRLHYLWNAKTDDPNVLKFPGADTMQAGEAIHINLATAYEIIPNTLRLGINSYYLNQISDVKVDGNDVSGRQEKVLGIGPGAVYHFSKDNHVFLNYYKESGAENRAEGSLFNLRYTHHF